MFANHRLLPPVFLLMLIVFVICVALSTLAGIGVGDKASAADPKLADGLAAWEQVYTVLTSPRCINCHTATNYPQQGDDRRRHFANVIQHGRPGRAQLAFGAVVNAVARPERSAIVQRRGLSCCDGSFKEQRS